MEVDELEDWWDLADPRGSRERFERALESAHGNRALVLRTQLARTYGLDGEFERARGVLDEVRPHIEGSIPEVQARYWLEWGRTYCSATHEDVPAEDRIEAERAFERAAEAAHQARLDVIEVDALHMLALAAVDSSERIRFTRLALALALASDQADAQRWEASLRNNLGYELATAGEHSAAEVELNRSVELRRLDGDVEAVRIAEWMVGWNARLAGDLDAALAIQSRLEAEWEQAGSTDPYVWSELAAIHEGLGDHAQAQRYRELTE